MSQSNLLQGYNWESQYDDPQVQFSRPISDEVISVYEVYVKEEEESAGPNGRTNTNVPPTLPAGDENQLIQTECMDLDTAIDSDVINADGTVTKLFVKDNMKYKILDQNPIGATPDENVVMYSHSINEPAPASSTATRLIDKDDPRSRLHFVKYLKRDGKTLKIWECGICSKEFRHQYTLMRHLPTHTDERNFKCEACGKAFRQLSTLSQHKAIHSDARPYVCDFCKKTFNRVSTLISHRKTHSENKPHKCQVCGKGFHQKGNLRNHVFTHTNERPYKCELCGKGFNQMSNLVCHKVKAHAHAEKMQYACGICGKEFPRKFSLRSHEEYKHGIKYRHPTGLQLDTNERSIIRNKNVRIVQLPPSERSHQMPEMNDKNLLMTADYMDSVIIDAIDTKAMDMALLQGQTPFALFKPAKGIPVLVKVTSGGGHKHLLTPATADDLRIANKLTMSPTPTTDQDGVKAVQIKVPVVATVIQKLGLDGKFTFVVEPPGVENEHESLVAPLDQGISYSEHIRTEPERQTDPGTFSTAEDCNELLELAAQGGIQFVRATEDGRYEVMSNNEARDLMAQNSHDVTILDGGEADAINIVNVRGNGDMIIGDPDNQIMVLDSNPMQKSMPTDDIEILGEKDIKILDSKGLDDRFADGITFLSPPKIDDLLLGPKTLGIEGLVTSQQDLANILNHRSDVSNLSMPSQNSMTSLLGKSNASMPILNDTLPYVRSGHSLMEDLAILNGPPMDDQDTQDYDSKLKLPSVFDDNESDIDLITIGQSDVKLLGSANQNGYPALNEVKILGPKNHSQELMSAQYDELRMLSPYEQFLRSTASQFNDCRSIPSDVADEGATKEVKILGKRLGTGIITSTEDGNIVKVLNDKHRSMTNNIMRGLCNTVSAEPTDNGSTDSFLELQVKKFKDLCYWQSNNYERERDWFTYAQACSPCGSDFLSFENRLGCKDISPNGHFDRDQKFPRDRFTGELPDLD